MALTCHIQKFVASAICSKLVVLLNLLESPLYQKLSCNKIQSKIQLVANLQEIFQGQVYGGHPENLIPVK